LNTLSLHDALPIFAATETDFAVRVHHTGGDGNVSFNQLPRVRGEELVLNVIDGYNPARHVDSRCVFCANAAILIFSRRPQVRSGRSAGFDIDPMMRDALDSRPRIDKHQEGIINYLAVKTV
jgi:hypothetical protein